MKVIFKPTLSFYYNFSLWICLMCCSVSVNAQLPVEYEAKKFAMDFWNNLHQQRKRNIIDMNLLYSSTNGYLYIPENEGGFVWVSGEKGHPIILGYGSDMLTSESDMPDMLRKWMNAIPVSKDFVRTSRNISEVVHPLLDSEWTQDKPFNNLCPYYRYDDGSISEVPCQVGCVATATSEVMRYYAHPVALCDTLYGWSTSHYMLSDVMPGKKIDWTNILDSYDDGYSFTEGQAVAELSLYVGMACHMNYGVDASGSQIFYLIEPLQRVFDYSYVAFYDRARFSPENWNKMLQFELQRGVPLVYSAFSFTFAGHAFVIDGVDENGFYHVRWGNGSNYNGYFDIDVLSALENPSDPTEIGQMNGYFCNQAALAFHPEPLPAFDGDTLTYKADDIKVDKIEFLREPDLEGYVPVDVTLTNSSSDTISYTLVIFTAENGDSIDWNKTKTVGATAVTLYPDSTLITRVYCSFTVSEHTQLGISGDGNYILSLMPFELKKTTGHQLDFSKTTLLNLDSSSATFQLTVTNRSTENWAGDIITYCLVEEGNPLDTRHWTILNLAPGESLSDTISFSGLKPDHDYVFNAHCPWTTVSTYSIHTPSAVSVKDTYTDNADVVRIYSLQGIYIGEIVVNQLQDFMSHMPRGSYVVTPLNGRTKQIYNR